MTGRWTASLSAALGLWVGAAAADEFFARPVTLQPPVAQPAAAVSLGRPVATLGRPVPLGGAGVSPTGIAATSYTPFPTASGPIVRAQAPDAGPPPVPPPGVPAVPAVPAVPGPASVPPPDDFCTRGPVAEPAPSGNFLGQLGQTFGFGAGGAAHPLFQSDHSFDGFISPVTNPSEFEDPRALTELRPIFIFQTVPSSNGFAKNASIEFFGLQGRLAFTDRLSLVVQKFGWIHLEPGNGSQFTDVTGFAEVDIGPKFTFWRNECSGTLAAVGVTFELPVGESKVLQDTGDLSVRPYLSFAQNFGKTSYGSFNLMNTFGFNIATDNKRTDNFFSSWHLDFNVANANKIYPLIELNWRHYIDNGGARNIDFEGSDLFNLGAEHVAGHDTVTFGPGVRYKFTEWAQVGTAFEVPIIGHRDLEEFRWTLDFILRY